MIQQPWLLLFAFSPPLFFAFLASFFFSFAGHLVGFVLVGRVFGKAFRILGLGERKGRWAMEQDFHGDFQVNVTWFFASFSGVLDWIVLILVWFQGAKKIIFTACHSGKPKLAFTSPNVISNSPQNFLFFPYSNSSLNISCPSGKLKAEFTSPITKSTSPGLSDTTFFARWPFERSLHSA